MQPKMNGGAAFVRSLAVGMFGKWAGRVVSPRAGFCASGRPLSARSAYADTGANGWIILPFSRKERLFGHGGKWMDHPYPPFSRKERLLGHGGANGWIIPTFQPQKSPMRTRGAGG